MAYKSKVGDQNAHRQVGMGNRYVNELYRPTPEQVKPRFNIGTPRRLCHWCKQSKPIKAGKIIYPRFFRCADCLAKAKQVAA